MNYRYMRLIVFFDLPMESDKDRREYAKFRKFLLGYGFIMMQKSVYTKLVVNNVTSAAIKKKVSDNVPPSGIVEMLEVTENQFSKIEYLVGESNGKIIDSTERIIEF